MESTKPQFIGTKSASTRVIARLLIVLLLAVATMLAGSAPIAAQVSIVANGSFEQPDIGGTSFTNQPTGNMIGPWQVESGDVDLIGTLWQAADGKQSLDMDGNTAGTILQDVTTTPGQPYQLSFAMAGNPQGGPSTKQMEVLAGDVFDEVFSFDGTGRTTQDMGWQTFTRNFVANTATTRLRFRSLTPGNAGPALDAVSVLPTTVAGATPAPAPPTPPTTGGTCVPGAPFFSETGYCIDNPQIAAYFQGRGGVTTFGFPVSRTVTMFDGFPGQFFQGAVLRVHPDGVKPLNLLDPGALPATTINFSTFPAHDPALATSAPLPSTPDYATAVLNHLQANVPNTFEGAPVNFLNSYLAAGGGDPLVALEVWGFPTSSPAHDPNNSNFIYQRFQRAILQFDASTGLTQRILLADYLKQVIKNDPVLLPADLKAQVQAEGNKFYNQYCPANPNWVCRPADLPNTDLTNAFEGQQQP